jgi:nucleoside-diphosphate-sugar epimerase
MKICITGIAGFIGSALAKALVEEGHTVTGIDDLSWGYEEDIPERCRWANRDILFLDRYIKNEFFPTKRNGDHDAPLADVIFGDVDVVIHCAANIEIILSQIEPTSDLRINTEGTVQVLEAMEHYGITKLVNFSSACVYGAGREIMSPVVESEAALSSPHWPYGASKLAAEIYCNLYARTRGWNVISLRPGIVCGPGEWYGRALTIFLRRCLEDKPIVVFIDPDYSPREHKDTWDGTPRRDFVHIKDMVRQAQAAVERVCKEQVFASWAINAGSGDAQYSILELAHKVTAVVGKGEVITEPVAEGTQSQKVLGRVRIPNEMKNMWLNMQRALSVLKCRPEHSELHEIIKDERDWLLDGGLGRWQSTRMKV